VAGGLLRAFATAADAPLIEDKNTIDKLFRTHRWRVMFAITIGYGLIYTCRLAIGMVKPSMIDAGIFTPAEFGLIGSALFYTYALGKLTNGFLADHANMRVFLTFGFVMTAICNIGMGFADSLLLATIIWGVNGWFQGFGAPGGVVAMTAWFSNKERGRAYGLWSTAHSIGEGLTFFVIGAVIVFANQAWGDTEGWRWGYFVPAMIGFVAAAMMWLMVRDRPRTMGLPTIADWKDDHLAESEASKAKSTLQLQFSILAIPTIWILALASLANYVTRYAINSWGPLYLQEARGFDEIMSGTMLMISTLAGIAGSLLYGFVSDTFFNARRPPANLLFSIVEIIGLVIIFFGPTNIPTLIVGMVLFGLGLTGLVASLGGLFAVDICPKRVAGAAMGVIGVFSYIGAAIQENISGVLIDQHSHMVGADRVYDFGPVIWFWIGSSIVSMLLAATLWRAKLRD
jgi:OPA family sugar phosphate sensor protein UhpC-like MFS transporter